MQSVKRGISSCCERGGDEMKPERWNRRRPPGIIRKRPKVQLRILLYLISILFAALSMLQAERKIAGEPIAGIFYGLTALVSGLSLWYLYQDLRLFLMEKLSPAIERNRLFNRLTKDGGYRTLCVTWFAFLVNLVFAAGNGIYGLLHHSWWFKTLAVYYLLLSIMRFGALYTGYKNTGKEGTPEIRKREWAQYKNCGRLLLLLTAALAGSVILMVTKDNGKTYPDTLILAVAAYTFYKITVSVINLIKAGKIRSPLILTIRHIGYTDSLVSMLSLQTAMFTTFGKNGELNIRLMNGVTGGAVCLMVFVMGIYMIASSVPETAAGGCLSKSDIK